MRPSKWRCETGGGFVGCGWSTNAVARSSGRPFSPQPRWFHVPPTATQDELRKAFARWGRPELLRVDNGAPWGSSGDLPTDLQLWLKGVGVGLQCNPPHAPQTNGKVERSQGTAKRWGEPGQCDTPEEFQKQLDVMDMIQREDYPSCAGQSRLAAYPGLVHSGQAYTRQWEETTWDFAAAAALLGGYAARRLVSRSGKISVYNRNYHIGILSAKKFVYLMFDPETIEWVVADEEGRQLSRKPAPEISPEAIQGLRVTHRRKPPRR